MGEWHYWQHVQAPRRGERSMVAEGPHATIQIDASGGYWYVRTRAVPGAVLGDVIRGPYTTARAAIAGGEAPWAVELPL